MKGWPSRLVPGWLTCCSPFPPKERTSAPCTETGTQLDEVAMSLHNIDNRQRPTALAHRPIRFARAVAVAAGASLLLGSAITPGQAEAPGSPDQQPKDPPPSELIFVHGYGPSATGKSCNKDREVDGSTQAGTWANALGYYEEYGDMDRSSMTTVGYYEGDVNCDESIGQFTNEAPIQDIAKELAIFIDSRDDQRPVDVVAHSMGGLVTRVALLGAAHGWWPEEVGKHELNVSNVVTLSTPHQGLTEERYENEENKTRRSEEHALNSSHVAISYAVFCLKKK